MNKIYNNKWGMLVLSLLLSVVLFLYVKTDAYSSNPAAYFSNVSEDSTETLTDVPVYVQGDIGEYFISGVPDKVTVELTGPRNIIDQTLHSQNFKVVTEDLSNIGIGRHYVQLQINGISSDISYKISPSTVPITVSQLESQSFPVEVILNNPGDVKDGYQIESSSSSPATVSLSGSSETLARVAKVYITVNLPKDQSNDYTASGTVIVEDSSGNILNIKSDPETVTANIKIRAKGKTLPLEVTAVNGEDDMTYEIDLGQNQSITVYGSESALSGLTSVKGKVDVQGLSRQGQKKVQLDLPSGVTAGQSGDLTVTVSPKHKDNDDNDNNEENENARSENSSRRE